MKILVATSTFPVSEDDAIPAFVRDQVIELKKRFPEFEFIVHTPHNFYSDTVAKLRPHEHYKEVRYHYFRPYKWERLVGRGIMPALRQNKWLYLLIPFLLLFQFFSLLRFVLREKPDLMYAHWFMPQAVTSALVARLTRTPFVFTTHASDVSVLHKMPFSRHLVRSVCKHAKAYTAVSRRTADKLKRPFNEEDWERNFRNKLAVIPMGVTTTLPDVAQEAVAKVSQKYNLPAGKRYGLFIGRLAEKKGVNYLLEAIGKLSAKDKEVTHFIIAGDGLLRDELQAQAAALALPNVTFTGYVHGSDKAALLQLADFVCFPSIIDSNNDSEGFPVAIMESLAVGKVVLVSDVSGAETVVKDGVSGFIFKEKSAAQIKKAMVRALRQTEPERQKMQARSRKLAKRFDWDTVAREHYQVFKRAMMRR